MRPKVQIAIAGAVVILLSGCNDHQAEQAAAVQSVRQAEELLKIEAAAQHERLKKRVTENPGEFIQASDYGTFDKGIINTYRQLVNVTLLNRSAFSLTNMKGEVEWVDNAGEIQGATAFHIQGALPAGDSKTFSVKDGTMTSGTIESSAPRIRLKFAAVSVVESPE